MVWVAVGRNMCGSTELVYRTCWQTREQAENALFASIDRWCNTRRIQRRLGYLGPDEYEAAYEPNEADPATAGHTPTPTGVR